MKGGTRWGNKTEWDHRLNTPVVTMIEIYRDGDIKKWRGEWRNLSASDSQNHNMTVMLVLLYYMIYYS